MGQNNTLQGLGIATTVGRLIAMAITMAIATLAATITTISARWATPSASGCLQGKD